MASSKIFFESFLFPLNGEANLSVESQVATGPDVDVVAVFFPYIRFSCDRVVEYTSPLIFGPWSSNFNTKSLF